MAKDMMLSIMNQDACKFYIISKMKNPLMIKMNVKMDKQRPVDIVNVQLVKRCDKDNVN